MNPGANIAVRLALLLIFETIGVHGIPANHKQRSFVTAIALRDLTMSNETHARTLHILFFSA
jgi:hypothetical protein